jgi:hypothetical protein
MRGVQLIHEITQLYHQITVPVTRHCNSGEALCPALSSHDPDQSIELFFLRRYLDFEPSVVCSLTHLDLILPDYLPKLCHERCKNRGILVCNVLVMHSRLVHDLIGDCVLAVPCRCFS